MPTQHFLPLFFFLLLSSLTTTTLSLSQQQREQQEDTLDFVRRIDRKLLGLNKEENLSHFKFYWHDTLSGHNPTSIPIVPPSLKINSTTFFGLVNFYLLMAMNFAFIEGKYNGSSLTTMGRNPALNKVREMPIIGGSGFFRFARGYAQLTTNWFDPKSGDACVEYNVYVFHY